LISQSGNYITRYFPKCQHQISEKHEKLQYWWYKLSAPQMNWSADGKRKEKWKGKN